MSKLKLIPNIKKKAFDLVRSNASKQNEKPTLNKFLHSIKQKSQHKV